MEGQRYASVLDLELILTVLKHIAQPDFADRFFVAAPVLLHADTFVIMIDLALVVGAGFAAQIRATVAAEQLGGQQVIIFGLMAGRSLSVLLHTR